MGVFLVLLGGIFWAISGVLAEYLFKNNYSVDWVCFYRLLSTGLILIFLSFKAQKILVFTNLKESLSICMFGFFGLLLTQFGYFKAIYYTDAGTATMIQYCAPLIIMLYLCFKNKKLIKAAATGSIEAIILALRAPIYSTPFKYKQKAPIVPIKTIPPIEKNAFKLKA